MTESMWEATITLESQKVITSTMVISSMSLVKFPATVDFQPILDFLNTCGFEQSQLHNAHIYALTEATSIRCANFVHAISSSHMGVLRERQILLFATSYESLEAILDAEAQQKTRLTQPGGQALATRVGDVLVAQIRPGVDACAAYNVRTLIDTPSLHRVSRKMLHEQFDTLLVQLHPYATLVVAALYDPQRQPSMVFMQFADAQTALADQAPRTALAETGMGRTSRRPYKEDSFVLEDSRLQDTILELHMNMLGAPSMSLERLFRRNDVLFAYCP